MTPADINPHRRRLYVMRHGSVTYFDDSGQTIVSETVPLNDAGRLQADAAGAAFAAIGARFDRVIVSGLPRTVETAARVLAASGQDITPEVWTELQELRAGRISDIPEHELRDAFLGAFEGVVPESRRFLGGESIGELLDRVHPAVARLRAADDWDTALLVLHGGVNRAILSLALSGQRMYFGAISQAPACINILDVGTDDWVVRATNMAAYDLLQPGSRRSTLETMLGEYLRTRKLA